MPGSTQVYMITGANRGIGLGLLTALLARDNTVVIATARTDAAAAFIAATASALENKGVGSAVHTAILDFTRAPEPETIRTAVEEATKQAAKPIDHIDVLICNAAHTTATVTTMAGTTADSFRASFEANTIAPLMVFQAVWPLLQRRVEGHPKVVMMSSFLGSIGDMKGLRAGSYGPSKAALNWIARALHMEHKDEGLLCIALHPGFVQTDAGRYCAEMWGYESGPPQTVDESVTAILDIVDDLDEEGSGRFATFDGKKLGW